MAQARPPLAYLSEITPQPTLPAFADYADVFSRRTAQPKRFTVDDWHNTGDLRGQLAGYGEKYLGMSPQQANTVFGAGAEPAFMSISDLTPGLDTALAVNDVRKAYGEGDYFGAGLSALGAIPMAAVGTKLAKGAIKGGKAATTAALTAAGVLAPSDEAQAGPLDKAGQAVLRAFHSSPHKFDKFEWSPRTARTGEGGAAYGEGLYLAENPAVSGRGGQYWNQFLRKFEGPERDIATRLQEAKFDPKAVTGNMDEELAWLEYNVKHATSPEAAAKNLKLLNETQDALRRAERGEAVGPHTYEVGIRARPEDLLDWDKPLKEQPRIRSLVEKAVPDDLRKTFDFNVEKGITGSNVYANYVGGSKAQASEALRDAGIPGHRFLDQGSRGQAQHVDNLQRGISDITSLGGTPPTSMLENFEKAKALMTRNYVIWQPELLDILKRYGGVGAAPLAGLGAYGASRQEQAPPVY